MKLSLASLLAVSASLLFFLVPRDATAQTITIPQEASLPRLDANGTAIQKRMLQLNPEGVSARDCIEDQRIRVPLLLTGFEPNATFQAWASHRDVDCSAPSNRVGP